ncbi:PAS domain S-box protein [Chitinivorax sp. PXF-14]|uniref:sensor domain-containing protein n=1 Tax=Chitinivorax sp. PXF-14 TaxID=3230488 RepID=UPI003465F701
MPVAPPLPHFRAVVSICAAVLSTLAVLELIAPTTALAGWVAIFVMLLAWCSTSQALARTFARRQAAHLAGSEERMRAIVETAVDAIVTADAQGHILDFNPGAERMFGHVRAEVIGRNLGCLMPDEVAARHDGYMAAYMAGGAAHVIGIGREVTACRANGDTFPAYLTVGEARLESGTLFVGILRDLTEQKKLSDEIVRYRDHLQLLVDQRTLELADANRSLRRELAIHERMELAIKDYAVRVADLYNLAPCGYHSLAPDGTILKINDTELNWLGYQRREVEGQMHISRLLDDAGMAIFNDRFPRFVASGASGDIECVLRRKDGTGFPVLVNATAVYDDAGQFLYSRSTIFDLSQRKQLENALFAEKHRLHTTLQAITDAVLTLDRDYRICYCNPAAQQLLGCPHSPLLGRPLGDVLQLLDDSSQAPFLPLVGEPCRTPSPNYALLERDGDRIVVSYTCAALQDQQGVRTGMVMILRDATEERRAASRLSFAATHDALTGLPNRQLFLSLLEHHVEQAARHQLSFCVLFIDLDGFKPVNDTLGHQAGDILLKQVAGRLSQCLRGEDALARHGGDEFTLLVSGRESGGTTLPDATRVAQRILDALDEPFIIDTHAVRVGASIGIAVYPHDGATPCELLEYADLAMYRAKALGGHRYITLSAQQP